MLLPVLGFGSLVAASIAVTLAVHGPLNFEILEWSAIAPPPSWEQVRDRWASWQGVRVVLAIVAFLLLVFPLLSPRRQ